MVADIRKTNAKGMDSMKTSENQVKAVIEYLEFVKNAIAADGESEFAELRKRDRKSIADAAEERFGLDLDSDGDSDGSYRLLTVVDFQMSFSYRESFDDVPYALHLDGDSATMDRLDEAIGYLRGLIAPTDINIVNLTPHTVHIMPNGPDGEVTSIPSSGEARAQTSREKAGTINGIQVYRTRFGAVEGLPEPQPNTIYIVSSITAQAVPHRDDVFIPDDIVRDEQGRVIGCRALGRI